MISVELFTFLYMLSIYNMMPYDAMDNPHPINKFPPLQSTLGASASRLTTPRLGSLFPSSRNPLLTALRPGVHFCNPPEDIISHVSVMTNTAREEDGALYSRSADSEQRSNYL
ncbi:hypothetical protein AG1IA_03628 [Rhizoctonia solani AG-1 IA]|uniref:Uncharacterized protein n=1 Tax=Thanatephorus cucumeris (strain AG1-IA) TaxID=983506 RepID=L8X161_THACA|nr:hypothetical protein AG1IA_03628 [Rhizoctonia solani AG-1 IA]